ncbi:hypothetical protein BD410DRAFT_831360 [Rickenella mellea]|uniref:mRNA 3'-end-processing protein RNA14 n=1 Tax=Rickenella mellea TaxID=50990 RepID=A0A4Y7PQH3_9AGAM|nr:hypothetical protein BD410DRAFT_831360 [Rickenella mellea]
MDALRKVYHRAVQIPLENVEVLWKELDAFEMGLNKITAKKFLQDLTPSQMTARTALRDLRKHLAPLFPPPPASSSTRPQLQLSQKPESIANRDLGLAMLNNSRNLGLGRTETLSVNSNSQPSSGMQSQSQIIGGSGLAKRPSSPERPRRDEPQRGDYGPSHKKSRPLSPPPPPLRDSDRDRDRDRWDPPPPKGRRYGSPMYDRDRERDRDRSPMRRPEKEREEPEKPPIPQVLSWFLGTLQPPTSFDGPKFRVDDLMQVFRNAVIPSNPRLRSPPPPPRNVRPPLDYGPYQGPSGRGGRRY